MDETRKATAPPTRLPVVQMGFDGQAEILPVTVSQADPLSLVTAVDALLAFAQKWRGRKMNRDAENTLAELDHRVAASAAGVGFAVPQSDAVPLEVRIRDPLLNTPRVRRYGFTALPMVGRDIVISPEWEWRMRALRGFATCSPDGKKSRRTYPAIVREKWLEWIAQHGDDRDGFISHFNRTFANRGECAGKPKLLAKTLADALRQLK